jgi:glycyl-tRNA synthetase beta chain
MSADFLLELLSEEIPARMQAKARNDLSRLFAEGLSAAGLSHGGIITYSTPRRLALIAKGLPPSTEAVREELKGPRTSAPPQALEGFLRKIGLTQEQLEDRDGIWFAKIDKPGRTAGDVLAELIPQIIRDFPWPKSMRWGTASQTTASLRWVRPLHSIVALLGEEIVPVQVEGVACGAATLGHRFHHPGQITIGGAHDYVEKLRACHVIVDQEERETIIRDGVRQLADDAGFYLVEDEGLVVENAGLTEWPVPLLGSFDHDYLDVPEEVIQLTARINQKYFVMRGGDEKIAPHFICTANITANDGGVAIVAGNERVLAARLSDARFFWEQDLKVPLEDYLPKLDAMLFYEDLGTLRSKAERTAKLSAHIAKSYFPNVDPQTASRAGELAKADLATGMVGEFPELQGIMGSYYAERAGEKPGVVSALKQQYQQSVEGCIPACVALADRIDTLVAFFSRGIKPTGSKDPFALRRAALQTIQTILANGIRLNLRAVFAKADSGLPYSSDNSGWVGEVDIDELMEFFADRLKVQQREAGVRHDLIDAVFALGGEDDLVRLLARVTALQAFVETGEGTNLLAGYKRAANILAIEEKKDGKSYSGQGISMPGDPPEEVDALVSALAKAAPEATSALEREDFAGAMRALSKLRGPVDAFFDKVTVNADVSDVRVNRLKILSQIRDALGRVADFSKVEG